MNHNAIAFATSIAAVSDRVLEASSEDEVNMLVKSLGADERIGEFLCDYNDPKAGVTIEELATGLSLAAARICLGENDDGSVL
jgi:hypothetical protein